MSKDFTPRELLVAESILKRKTWVDIAAATTVSINGDPPKPEYTSEEIDTLRSYSYLGRIYSDWVLKLHKKGFINELGIAEKEVSQFIADGSPKNDSVVSQWFYGELDPNFYYSTRNNETFAEYIMEKRQK